MTAAAMNTPATPALEPTAPHPCHAAAPAPAPAATPATASPAPAPDATPATASPAPAPAGTPALASDRARAAELAKIFPAAVLEYAAALAADPATAEAARLAGKAAQDERRARMREERRRYAEAMAAAHPVPLRVQRLHPLAVLPRRAYAGDAGLDLTALEAETLLPTGYDDAEEESPLPSKMAVRFGIAVEIPRGYVGLIFPRSSIHKTRLRLSNAVGVIDSGYRGELRAVFDLPFHARGEGFHDWGKPCAQLVILPCPAVQVQEVAALTPSERGARGFGSSNDLTPPAAYVPTPATDDGAGQA